MSILNAFKRVFETTYSGKNSLRDYKVLLELYFPEDVTAWKTTEHTELVNKIADVNNRSRVGQIVELFEVRLADKTADDSDKDIRNFKQKLTQISNQIDKFGYFVSGRTLASSLGVDRSLVGIFDIARTLQFPINFAIISLNNQGFIVPSDITGKHLRSSYKDAWDAAQRLGAVFPYEKLRLIPSWQYIPNKAFPHFAKELLESGEGFLDIDKTFFGYVGRDRFFSQLRKIYAVYTEVPVENLTTSLYRTIKKRISGETKISNGSQKDETILDECIDGFDEYCLQMDYYSKKGNLRIATPMLKNSMAEYPHSGKLYQQEIKLVEPLRKNGAPMHTNEFIPLLQDFSKPTQIHIMESADLIYRKGFKYNSTYHTLDDRYEVSQGKIETIHQIDRTRVAINRINRKMRLARKVKVLCENKCQVCGDRIKIGESEYYSEAHHIQPLGTPHNGKDKLENMICVCPNCHVKLDYGIIRLDRDRLYFLDKHPIGDVYISYHNKTYFPDK
jgi:hypothetical protein